MQEMQSRGTLRESCRLAPPDRACNEYYSALTLSEEVIPPDRAIGFLRGKGANERVLCQDATDLYQWFRANPSAKVPLLECDLSDKERQQILARAEALLPPEERREQAKSYAYADPTREELLAAADSSDEEEEAEEEEEEEQQPRRAVQVNLATELATVVSQPARIDELNAARQTLLQGGVATVLLLRPNHMGTLNALPDDTRSTLLDQTVNRSQPNVIAPTLIALGTSAFLYRLEPIVIEMIQALAVVPSGAQRVQVGLHFVQRGDTSWQQEVLRYELMRILLYINDLHAFAVLFQNTAWKDPLQQLQMLAAIRGSYPRDAAHATTTTHLDAAYTRIFQSVAAAQTFDHRLPAYAQEALLQSVRGMITEGDLDSIELALAPGSISYLRALVNISRNQWHEDLLPRALRASTAAPNDERQRRVLQRLVSSTLVEGDLSEYIRLVNQQALPPFVQLYRALPLSQHDVLLPDAYRYALYTQKIELLLVLYRLFGINASTRDALLQSATAYNMPYMRAFISARLVPNTAPAPSEQPPRAASPSVATAPAPALVTSSVHAPAASEPDAWIALQQAVQRNDLHVVDTLLAPGSDAYRAIYAIPYDTRLQTIQALADAASRVVRQRFATSAPFLDDPPLSAAFPLVLADLDAAGSAASLGPALTHLSRRRITRDRVEQVAPDLIRYAKFRRNPRLEQDVVQRFEGVTLPDDVRRTSAPAPAPAPVSASRTPAPASGVSASRARANRAAPASRAQRIDPLLYEAVAHDDYPALVELIDANQANLTIDTLQMLMQATVGPRRRTAANRQVRELLQTLFEAAQE